MHHTPYVETSVPKRALFKNDFVLFVFVVLSAFLLILSISYLFYVLSIDGLWPQLFTFALLLAYGWWIYKKQLVHYRYTVGGSLLSIERTVGRKSRSEAVIHLRDIRAILPMSSAKRESVKRADYFHCGRKRDATAILYRVNGEKRLVAVSLSPDGIAYLKQAVKTACK